MFTKNQPKSKDFDLNWNGWFLMILAKFKKKILPNGKFGSVRPKELCVYVFFFFVLFFVLFCFVFVFMFCFVFVFVFVLFLFCFCLFFICFLFVFVFCFSLFSFFFLSFFLYSSPDLEFALIFPILHDFSFKNTKFSASERAHPPPTSPLCASVQL